MGTAERPIPIVSAAMKSPSNGLGAVKVSTRDPVKQQHGITDGIDVFKKVTAGEHPSREGWWSAPSLGTS
jgi:hypothetical protein